MLDTFDEALQAFGVGRIDTGPEVLHEGNAADWLFYSVVTHPKIDQECVHLNARDSGVDRRVFDVGIGPFAIGSKARLSFPRKSGPPARAPATIGGEE